MTKQKWMVQNKKAEFNELAKKLGVNPVTVRIMRNRDLTTEEEMRAFLMADERQFFDPFLMKDLKEGISVIIHGMFVHDYLFVIPAEKGFLRRKHA